MEPVQCYVLFGKQTTEYAIVKQQIKRVMRSKRVEASDREACLRRECVRGKEKRRNEEEAEDGPVGHGIEVPRA